MRKDLPTLACRGGNNSRVNDSYERWEFSVIKYLDSYHMRLLIRRHSDGEVLLGEVLDTTTKIRGVLRLLDTPASGMFLALLNHENLVSIFGVHHFRPERGISGPALLQRPYLLWDYCDGGTLDSLLRDPPILPTAKGFLPPSLCWHVLTSLLRALTWLHDGCREDEAGLMGAPDEAVGDSPGSRMWCMDPDWLPVLHRNLTPDNVFIQRSRGTETYGLVKLGNYSRVHVSGTVVGSNIPVMTSTEGDVPYEGLRRMMRMSKEELLKVPKRDRPYTRCSELSALGAILYRMMTNLILPDSDDSDARMGPLFAGITAYDRKLKDTVARLLRMGRTTDGVTKSTAQLYQDAAVAYEEWRATNPDGQMVVTLEEDLAWRERQGWATAAAAVETKEKDEEFEDDESIEDE